MKSFAICGVSGCGREVLTLVRQQLQTICMWAWQRRRHQEWRSLKTYYLGDMGGGQYGAAFD
jgi:hypothetical protein